jgi:hypothetical protein
MEIRHRMIVLVCCQCLFAFDTMPVLDLSAIFLPWLKKGKYFSARFYTLGTQ